MIFCWTFAACHPCLAGSRPESATPRTEVWVASARGTPGDGSRARPFGSLDEVLGPARPQGGALRVRLLPGRHRVPPVLPAGLELVGTAEGAVLEGQGEGPVVRAPEGVRLEEVDDVICVRNLTLPRCSWITGFLAGMNPTPKNLAWAQH